MNDSQPTFTPMDKPSPAPSSVAAVTPPADEPLERFVDACRLGSNDLADPDFAPLARAIASDATWRARYDASQAADLELRRELDKVSLPGGLEARLRQRLGLAVAAPRSDSALPSVSSAVASELAVASAVVGISTELPIAANTTIPVSSASPTLLATPVRVDIPAPSNTAAVSNTAATPASAANGSPHRRHTSWHTSWHTRRWFVGGGLASVALTGLCAVVLWQSASRTTLPETSEVLAQLSGQWAATAMELNGWHSEIAELPADRTGQSQVSGNRTRWRTLRTTCDRETFVVEVRRGNQGAWLFSFRGSLPFLKNFVPPKRISGSQDNDVLAWTDGALVFVLVAQGKESRLESWIRPHQFAIFPTLPAHVPPSQSPKSLQAERPLLSARHDWESRVRGVACVGFHGSSWAS